MKYFQNIITEEKAKQHYRLLAKELHPDRGDSVDEFQKMDKEY
jgi:curved DNA-binding protein CbpA